MKKTHKIRRSSLRYRFANWIWEGKIEEKSKKACTFYWGRLLCGTLLVLLWYILAFGIIIPIFWFLGFHWVEKIEKGVTYHQAEYKYNGKTRQRFAPWEIVLAIATIGFIIYLSVFNQPLGRGIGIVGGITVGVAVFAITILALLLLIFSKAWKSQISRTIKEAFAKGAKAFDENACPPIEYID